MVRQHRGKRDESRVTKLYDELVERVRKLPPDRRQLLRDDLQRLQLRELQESLESWSIDDFDLPQLAEACEREPSLRKRLDELEAGNDE